MQATNPFDPQTPPGSQAPITIHGRIQSVTAPVIVDGQEIILEAASCADFDGEHSGFEVILRGLGFAGDTDGIRAASQLTESNGLFLFENAPPGDYSVEFTRIGYDVPPPITLTLAPGEVLEVPTRCGVRTASPPRPLLSPLPSRTTDALLSVDVIGCDADPSFTTEVVRSGTGEVLSKTVPTEDGSCSVSFPLAGDGDVDLALYQLSAVTTDALGNLSVSVDTTITYDVRPPSAPTTVNLIASASRLDIDWDFTPPDAADDAAADDGAALSIVSYSILPREQNPAADCPFGTPVDDDPFDVAAFASEGRSPQTTSSSSLSLTGIPTGTTIWIQVAGVDSLGNRGCFSEPRSTRVDEVTVSTLPPITLTNQGSTAVAAGVVATALGTGGLALLAPDGTTTSVATPSFDVVASTRQFFSPAGEAGLSEVEVDANGAVINEVVHAIGTVRSVAKRPGVVVMGTDVGVLIAADADITTTLTAVADPGALAAPVARIENFGDALILLRLTQPPRIQVVRRDDPLSLLGNFVVNQTPKDMLVTPDAIWLALGNGRIQRLDRFRIVSIA